MGKCRVVLKVLLISLFLEIVLFNYRHWESLFFKEIQGYNIVLGSGLQKKDDNVVVIDNQQSYLEIQALKGNVKNIYLNIYKVNESIGSKVLINVMATDEANKNLFSMPTREIVQGIELSKYIRVHLSGNSENIRINISEPLGTEMLIDSPKVNLVLPFQIKVMRFALVLLGVTLLHMFSPKSCVYGVRLDLSQKWQLIFVAVVIGIHMLAMLGIGNSIRPSETLTTQEIVDSWPANSQYNELADALMKGQVYLDREPPKSLTTMDNPYDPGERWKVVVEQNQEKFDWDYAYYNGRYYSYFGVIPVLLFFIPYKLITGSDLYTWHLVTACGMLFCAASFYLIYQIAKKYFGSISFGMYILMSSLYIWASAIIYLVHYGNIYSCPIMVSLLFGTLGLAILLSAGENEISKKRLVLGSVLIALIMGCRPQLAIIILLAFPIFWEDIVIRRNFFSKKGLLNTCCVIVPFLIIGFFLMGYNYVRFGSPLDFGANYNLTGNDMTHRGFVFERWPLGLFEYLFQPIPVKPQFPFLQTVDLSNDYMGYTSVEFIIGGFFGVNLITLLSLWIVRFKQYMKEYRIYGFAILCFFSAIILILVDIQMSGITQRYMSDFGWLISISTICILLSIVPKLKDKHIFGIFHTSVASLVGLSIFINLFGLLIVGRYADLINMNPYLYYTLKYWMPFY